MTDQQRKVKELWDAGHSRAEMCQTLNIRSRWLRRLLQSLRIRRPVGRPSGLRTVHFDAQRISYSAAGVA